MNMCFENLIFKRIILIVLVLFCTSSFASIVSDNDESVLITKSEFESLKKDFSNQIDNYKFSVDKKIDGAISSYLANYKLQKQEKIDRLLDENAVYGGKYKLHWKSNTNTRRINLDYTYANLSSVLCSMMSQVNNGRYYGGQISWSNWHNGIVNNIIDPVEVAWKYKYKDGSTYKYSLYYELVKNSLQINAFFQFPLNDSNWSSGINSQWEYKNLLDINSTELKQNQLNNKIATYFRYYNNSTIWECWSVWKQAYMTLNYTETNTKNIVMHPFSTIHEKVWDKDDTTLDLGYSSETSVTPQQNWSTPGPTPEGYPDLTQLPGTIKMVVPNSYWCPWQLMEDNVQLNKREIKNLTDVSNKNFAFENGIAVGTIPAYNDDMQLTAKFTVTQNGIVYIYVGYDRINNWKETSFTGKKINITDVSKEYQLKIDNVKKNETIWMLYEPIITDKVKNLCLNDLYIEK